MLGGDGVGPEAPISAETDRVILSQPLGGSFLTWQERCWQPGSEVCAGCQARKLHPPWPLDP